MTDKNTQRVLWIDAAKTIGIFLVVLGHLNLGQNYLTLIFTCHMPLFFFISGYLEKKRTIKEEFLNGIRTLIIPYIIFYLLLYPKWLFFSFPYDGEDYTYINIIVKPMLGMILGEGHKSAYYTPVIAALWFLVGLFVVKLIHSAMTSISRNIFHYLFLNVLIIIIILIVKLLDLDLLWSLDSALLAILFYSVGFLIRKESNLFQHTLSLKKASLYFTICFITLIYLAPINGRVDMNLFVYGNSLILFYVFGFLGILSIIFLSQLYTKENRLVKIISSGTIIILAFHGPISSLLLTILKIKDNNLNPLVAIAFSIFILLVLLGPIIIIQKYFPILIGGRKIY